MKLDYHSPQIESAAPAEWRRAVGWVLGVVLTLASGVYLYWSVPLRFDSARWRAVRSSDDTTRCRMVGDLTGRMITERWDSLRVQRELGWPIAGASGTSMGFGVGPKPLAMLSGNYTLEVDFDQGGIMTGARLLPE